tara:strand:- start:79 stop:330 length:252 start_codon:yes stop_codon:yes gene_type:complete
MLFKVGQLVNRIEHRIDLRVPEQTSTREARLQKHLHPGIVAGFESWGGATRMIVIYDIRTGEKHYVSEDGNTVHILLEGMNGV